jgi:hypothetical protein
MLESGGRRIMITGSVAAYLPGGDRTAYPPSKAALCRNGEMLAKPTRRPDPVFSSVPGSCRPS